MNRQETIPLARFREQLSRFSDDTPVFFGCPDEANPLEFVEVEELGNRVLHVKFRLNIYRGRN